MFICDQCGKCCQNLGHLELYKNLDRGDGVCKYLVGHLCSIYDHRPLLCRVEESYEVYFSKIYSKEEYDRLNTEACKLLKSI